MNGLARLAADMKRPASEAWKISREVIGGLYDILLDPSDKTRSLSEDRSERLGYVYGDLFSERCGNVMPDIGRLYQRLGIYSPEQSGSSEKPVGSREAELLLLSVQTFFALLMKYILLETLEETREKVSFPYEDIITGAFAGSFGIDNYRCEDRYCWPVFELDRGAGTTGDNIAIGAIMEKIRCLVDMYTVCGAPPAEQYADRCDSIKKIYETLLPRELRHALGEYYTPGWLARMTFEEALAASDSDISSVSVIDPACGAGTFLVTAAAAKRAAGCPVSDILSSVTGTDIDPLAVLTAKTSLLLSVADMLGGQRVAVRVYNADLLRLDERTEAHNTAHSFVEAPVQAVSERIQSDRAAAHALEKADIVAGNPPWVNWEYLPAAQKSASRRLWKEYGLFSAKGRDLSFSKEDISVLITYIAADRLLRCGGVLGFVIRQGVFKSARNGAGFRSFTIRGGTPLKVIRVEDLSDIRVFDGAMTRTALFFAVKGQPTDYPVPYYLWERKMCQRRQRINAYSSPREIRECTGRRELLAFPSVKDDAASPWITAEHGDVENAGKVLGHCGYRARTGIFTGGANAVYYLRINSSDDRTVSVSNITDRAKRKAPRVDARLEKTYIYPMLKGSGIKKWSARYDTYILCTHTARTKQRPVPEQELAVTAPLTMDYLRGSRDILDRRRGFSGWEKDIQLRDFHAIMRVGEYTFAPYKVVWKYIASEFVCAVIGSVNDPFLGEKLLLPNEKVMFIGTESEDEAYYLCGVLSSAPVAACVAGYMNPTSISAHVLDKLRIPGFDPSSPLHAGIARLCREGHSGGDIARTEMELDILAARLYGINAQ